MKTLSGNLLSILALLFALSSSTLGAEPMPTQKTKVSIQPRESDELLSNPGMGRQTFSCFADHDRNLAGLLSASAYFRFYWDLHGKTAVKTFDLSINN